MRTPASSTPSEGLVHELKLNTEQLKAVGNDPLKLTMQYQGGGTRTARNLRRTMT